MSDVWLGRGARHPRRLRPSHRARAAHLLESLGLSTLIVKTALAASLSWALASWLVGERPYFAPLAAILSIQATVAASLSRGVQRSLGVVLGILLATAAAHWVGANPFSVGALVLVGTALASRMHLGPYATPQVAVTALLVLTLGGHTPAYAVARAADTVIGAGLAVLLNATLAPADFSERARRSTRHTAAGLAGVWRCLGRSLASGQPVQILGRARGLEKGLRRSDEDLGLALESLRLSPLRSGSRSLLERTRHAQSALERAFAHTRGAARLFEERLQPHLHDWSLTQRQDLARVCRTVAQLVARVGQTPPPPGFDAFARGDSTGQSHWSRLYGPGRAAWLRVRRGPFPPGSDMAVIAFLVEIQEALEDLRESLTHFPVGAEDAGKKPKL